MANAKDLIKGIVKKAFLRESIVSQIALASPHFRWITLQGDALRGVKWTPGDKLQVGVQGVTMRAYTPLSWDEAAGSTQLLLYLHGEGPGAEWARSVREGDSLDLFGPRGSLDVAGSMGPVVFVGDETAFACARNLLDVRGGTNDVRFVFEVGVRDECTPVLGKLGLHDAVLVDRLPQHGHIAELQAAVVSAHRTVNAKRIWMVGSGDTGKALRKRLKDESKLSGDYKVKAYWIAGKEGLD